MAMKPVTKMNSMKPGKQVQGGVKPGKRPTTMPIKPSKPQGSKPSKPTTKPVYNKKGM
jgi:hypothetical protein